MVKKVNKTNLKGEKSRSDGMELVKDSSGIKLLVQNLLNIKIKQVMDGEKNAQNCVYMVTNKGRLNYFKVYK